MKEYYPGILPRVSGDPSDVFFTDEGQLCEYELTRGQMDEALIQQIEKADAVLYVLPHGVYQLVSPSFESGYKYRVTYYDEKGPFSHIDKKTARETAAEIGDNAQALDAVII